MTGSDYDVIVIGSGFGGRGGRRLTGFTARAPGKEHSIERGRIPLPFPGDHVRSLLQALLLLLIRQEPGHGYDLVERLGELGLTDVEAGQAYRALRSLERRHSVVSVWVTSPAGPPRRRYELTSQGRDTLESWRPRLDQLHTAIGSCLTDWPADTAPAGDLAGPGPDGSRDRCRAPGAARPAGTVTSARSALRGAAPGTP